MKTRKISIIYLLLVRKAEKKVRTQAEVDEVITWLTGYADILSGGGRTYAEFFRNAPAYNPRAERHHRKAVRH